MILLAWWSNKSDQILLSYYGYNIDGMNEAEFYEKVSEKKIERVKELQRSLMGIGWPLKAIMSYIYYFPYLLIAYLISYLVNKPRKKLLPKKLEKMK